jgi:hypothetical protein
MTAGGFALTGDGMATTRDDEKHAAPTSAEIQRICMRAFLG